MIRDVAAAVGIVTGRIWVRAAETAASRLRVGRRSCQKKVILSRSCLVSHWQSTAMFRRQPPRALAANHLRLPRLPVTAVRRREPISAAGKASGEDDDFASANSPVVQAYKMSQKASAPPEP